MILTGEVEAYIAGTRPEPDPVLAEMEAHAARDGIPVVHPPTGALLAVLTTAAQARRVVEVGTAIGVSTLYIARALPDGGTVTSFEIDPARHEAATEYLRRAGVLGRADLRLQDAGEGIASLDGPIDLAFVDGPKVEYRAHIEALLPLLRPGGLLVVDNVLMSGTVAAGRGDGHWTDEQVAAARELNSWLVEHPQLSAAITPVGDGVAVAARR